MSIRHFKIGDKVRIVPRLVTWSVGVIDDIDEYDEDLTYYVRAVFKTKNDGGVWCAEEELTHHDVYSAL